MRVARIIQHCKTDSPMMKIPPIAASEMRWALKAYYGGPVKMSLAVISESFHMWRMDINGRFCMWFCDKMGWTKLYEMPETATHHKYWQRHGRNCSGSPNCNNMNCIDEGMPSWFRWLYRRFPKI